MKSQGKSIADALNLIYNGPQIKIGGGVVYLFTDLQTKGTLAAETLTSDAVYDALKKLRAKFGCAP
ncbi:hypothetical protein ES708_29308 [subsurface metagenome]